MLAPLFRDPAILQYDIIAIQEPWMNSFEYTSHNPAPTWDHHIEAITTKVQKSVQAFRALTGSTWGFRTLQLRDLYRAVIVPQITYCSTVWFQPHIKALREGITKRYLRTLEGLQKEALIAVSGGFRLTAISALALEMHVLPIKQQLLQTNHITYLRLRANPLT